MNRREKPHWDVAAYALGVLESHEIERYELHLAECSRCAAELEYLLPAGNLLADVDPDDLRDAADPQLADRLLDSVRIHRHQLRRRRRFTVAAGTTVAAAVAGLALFAGATWLGTAPTGDLAGDPPATPDSTGETEPPATDLPDDGEGERFTAVDPDTGVQADVLLASRDWGTEVSLTLWSVTGPRECQLVVVRPDGATEVAASWRVPADGYGTSDHPTPLLFQTGTALVRADIAQLQVRALEPGGASTVLVTVPM